MPKAPSLRDDIITGLRRAFRKSALRKSVLDAGSRRITLYKKDGSVSKKYGVEHHCQVCNRWQRGEHDVDHIDPVIGLEGFIDWNTYVARMFPPADRLQRICQTCHDAKTAAEFAARWVIKHHAELDALPADPKIAKRILKRIAKRKGSAGDRARTMLAVG